MDTKTTLVDLLNAKREHHKLVVLSCYDYTTAKIAVDAGIDLLLVGDSAAQVILGYDSTLPATMDFMVAVTAAVRRAGPQAFVIGDMPFLSYQPSEQMALENAGRFVVEGGAQMVKIEVAEAHVPVVQAVSQAGIAVMAHIGIKPQTIGLLGRFKADGTTASMAMELVHLADRLVEAGARALLIEGTATEVAQVITERVEVPVISCGSGVGCDGQVLIASDILGLCPGPKPKFSKAFGELYEPTKQALQQYRLEIEQVTFPDDAHSYHMKKGELEKLKGMLFGNQ